MRSTSDVTSVAPLIFLVEDHSALQTMLRYNLSKMGYRVEAFTMGEAAWARLQDAPPDAIILDWMLPGLSGPDLCRRIRLTEALRTLPVLLMTARSAEEDSIEGLDSGADAFLTKPYSVEALEAHLRALLRRATPSRNEVLRFQDLTLNSQTRRASRGPHPLNLGPTEFRLLEFFMRHPREVFSRETLLKRVWNENIFVELRTIDVHIRRLRLAMKAHDGIDYIRTVRSAGYALDDQA